MKYRDERQFKVTWHGPQSFGSEVISALNRYHAIEQSSQDLITKDELHLVPLFKDLQELVQSRGGAISVYEIK